MNLPNSQVGTKLHNCFYVQARVRRDAGKEFYYYERVLMLREFDFDKFLIALDNGDVLVDFDARTGHNHGTKFRLRQNRLPDLYKYTDVIE